MQTRARCRSKLRGRAVQRGCHGPLRPRPAPRRIDHRRVAPSVVAAFRADAARAPDDPEFGRVVDELNVLSPEFAELWARHEVGVPGQAVKAVRHPDAGDLFFDMTTLAVVDNPGWYLELYNPR